MTEPRTVTVPTIDHGDVTIPEPSWCTGHDQARPEYLRDTGHAGTPNRLSYAGTELGVAKLVQNPLVEHSDRSVMVLVELGGDGLGLRSTELDDLAVILVDFAGTLRTLARQLASLNAGEGL